jgi:Flp pilus assembly pilin Flp
VPPNFEHDLIAERRPQIVAFYNAQYFAPGNIAATGLSAAISDAESRLPPLHGIRGPSIGNVVEQYLLTACSTRTVPRTAGSRHSNRRVDDDCTPLSRRLIQALDADASPNTLELGMTVDAAAYPPAPLRRPPWTMVWAAEIRAWRGGTFPLPVEFRWVHFIPLCSSTNRASRRSNMRRCRSDRGCRDRRLQPRRRQPQHDFHQHRKQPQRLLPAMRWSCLPLFKSSASPWRSATPRRILLRTFFANLIKDQSGVTAIEYALIAALIAVAAIAAFKALGTSLSDTFTMISNSV